MPSKLVMKEECRQYYTYQTDRITVIAQGLVIPHIAIRLTPNAVTFQEWIYSLPNPNLCPGLQMPG